MVSMIGFLDIWCALQNINHGYQKKPKLPERKKQEKKKHRKQPKPQEQKNSRKKKISTPPGKQTAKHAWLPNKFGHGIKAQVSTKAASEASSWGATTWSGAWEMQKPQDIPKKHGVFPTGSKNNTVFFVSVEKTSQHLPPPPKHKKK